MNWIPLEITGNVLVGRQWPERLQPEVKAWLVENLGPENRWLRIDPRPSESRWQFYSDSNGVNTLWVRDPQDAMLFKLTWGNLKPIN